MADKALAPETLKVVSVNANSLRRAWPKGLKYYLKATTPDIVCVQGTGMTPESPNTFHLAGYEGYFFYSTAVGGVGGTTIYTRIKPIAARIGIDEPDARVILVEFAKFTVVSVLVPGAGAELENLRAKIDDWFPKFTVLIKELAVSKTVIVGGDFNVAAKEIDIYDTAENVSAPGFTEDERGSFNSFLADGFVDVFRERHPGVQTFTYFGHRFGRKGRGRGWRRDYFLMSKSGFARGLVVDCAIDSAPSFGPHVPIVLLLNRSEILSPADTPVEATIIKVLNTDEVIPRAVKPEKAKPKPPQDRVTDEDILAIRAESRGSQRERRPVVRAQFEERDEKPAKKAIRVAFDDEEYGRSLRKKPMGKKGK